MSNDNFNMAEAVADAVPCADYVDSDDDKELDAYSNAAYYAAKVLMQVAAEDPEGFFAAAAEFRKNPYCDAFEVLMGKERRDELMAGRYGLTGFQWGYAVNAALNLLEQPPVPNPAVITMETPA